MKNNSDFLNKYQQLQLGIMYDKIIEVNSLKVCFNSHDPSIYWNNTFINRELNQKRTHKN